MENLQLIEDFYADAIDTVSTWDTVPGDRLQDISASHPHHPHETRPMENLSGRVAVITGGASGIGLALAGSAGRRAKQTTDGCSA